MESGHQNACRRGRRERSRTVTHMGGGGLKERQKQLPRQQVPQDAGVLHTERLHHGELPHLDPRQDVVTQLLAGGQDGHEGRRRGPAARAAVRGRKPGQMGPRCRSLTGTAHLRRRRQTWWRLRLRHTRAAEASPCSDDRQERLFRKRSGHHQRQSDSVILFCFNNHSVFPSELMM